VANSVVGNYYQTRVFTVLDAQTAINVWGWQCTAITGTGVTMAELAANVRAGLATPFPPILTSAATFRGVGAQQAYPPKDGEAYSTAGALVGTGGAIPLPKQTCGISSIYDGKAGRKHRGRIYWPFPASTANTTDGQPTGAYVTLLEALKTYLGAGILVTGAGGTANFTFSLLHRATINGDQIIRIVSRTIWGTQRRRGDYGRTNASPV